MSGFETGRWSPMPHEEFLEWARVEMGETRQVYARDRRRPEGAPLVFMGENEAERFREDAHEGHLICLVRGCVSPKFIVKHCGDRRDHFAHESCAGVGREDYPRAVAQHVLHRWAAGLDERYEVLDDQWIGGVDVTVLVRLPEGERVGLCYTHGALGARAWECEQAALEREGVAGVWIFPPSGRYLTPPKVDPGPPVDTSGLICDKRLFRTMRGSGSWPLILNVEKGELANLIVPEKRIAARLGIPSPPLVEGVLHILAVPLAECGLCKDGIATGVVNERDLEKIRRGYGRCERSSRRTVRGGPVGRRSPAERRAYARRQSRAAAQRRASVGSAAMAAAPVVEAVAVDPTATTPRPSASEIGVHRRRRVPDTWSGRVARAIVRWMASRPDGKR